MIETSHKGSVVAQGLLWDGDLVSESELRNRILEAFEGGTRVYRKDGLWILLWPHARRMRTENTTGSLLSRQHNTWRSFSSASTATTHAQNDEAIEFLRAGAVVSLRVADLEEFNCSTWIDIAHFSEPLEVTSLGEVVALPRANALALHTDVRKTLGAPEMSPEAMALVQALARKSKSTDLATASKPFSWVSRLFSGLLGARAATTGNSPGPASASSWMKLQDRIARTLDTLLFGQFLGRRYSKYVRDLFRMLERGDTEEALRHAIPLGGKVVDGDGLLSLFGHSARTDFSIGTAGSAASAALGLAPELFQTLQGHYRRLFERLRDAGDIERAAFVLAELLHRDLEAIEFLESHKHLRLAAEVAEARDLPAGLVVRQWFLAGDIARAIAVARRTGAFRDAVLRLEKTHPQLAQTLRLRWAEHHAEAGAYHAAVDAIWPVRFLRFKAMRWIESIIAVGGSGTMEALLRRLFLMNGYSEDVETLAYRETEACVQARIRQRGSDERKRLLSEVRTLEDDDRGRWPIRALARSVVRHEHDVDSSEFSEWLTFAGDKVLSEDFRLLRKKQGSKRQQVRVVASAFTHEGKARTYNEDAIVLATLARPQRDTTAHKVLPKGLTAQGFVAAVLDGSGGFQTRPAEQAAHTVAREIWSKNNLNVLSRLALAVDSANELIWSTGQRDRAQRGAGTTATIAVVEGDGLFIAQIGDSRAYLLREGKLVQLSVDHTLLQQFIVNRLAENNPMSATEIDEFEHKGIVLNVIGAMATVHTDYTSVALQQNDVLLLCTDGIYNHVDPTQMILMLENEPEIACAQLFNAAMTAGGYDNIAIVVAKFGGGLPRNRGPIEVKRNLSPTQISSTKPVILDVDASDFSDLPISDFAVLPDGTVLLAVHELGCWLVDTNGKVLHRFSEPAHKIILSDHGDRAIIFAHRGEENVRISRIDLVRQREQYWCTTQIDNWCPTFDGFQWFVSRGATVFGIDATSTQWSATWQVSLDGILVHNFSRSDRELVVGHGDDFSVFELPGPVLRRRHSLPRTLPSGVCDDVLSSQVMRGYQNAPYVWYIDGHHEEVRLFRLSSNECKGPLLCVPGLAQSEWTWTFLREGLFALVGEFDAHALATWMPEPDTREPATCVLFFALAEHACTLHALVRFSHSRCVHNPIYSDGKIYLADYNGNVQVIDAESWKLLREFRVR